jgi:hypothetical protein
MEEIDIRRSKIDNDPYTKFGKYLLFHLGVDIDPDELDWLYIIKGFLKQTISIQPGLMYINWVVCHHFEVDPLEVRYSRSKKREYAYPKHIATYLADRVFNIAQEKIRDFYEYKNRSSIPNANTNVENLMKTNKKFKSDVEHITNKILGYEQIFKESISSTMGIPYGIQKTGIKEGNNLPLYRNGEIQSSD